MKPKAKRNEPRRQRRRRLLPYVLLLLALLVVLFPVVSPLVLNHVVVPVLQRRAGILPFSLAVTRLDSREVIAQLALGADDNPFFHARSVRADYTLVGILGRRIERITVDAPILWLERTGDGWRLPGMEGQMKPQAAGTIRLPKFNIDQIDIRNFRIVLKEPDRLRSVRCNATVRDVLFDRNRARIHLHAETTAAGHPVSFDLVATLRGNDLLITMDGSTALGLPSLPVTLPDGPAELSVSGWSLILKTDTDGHIQCQGRGNATLFRADDTKNTVAEFAASLELAGTRKASSGLLAARSSGLRTGQLALGSGFVDLPVTWPIPEAGLEAHLELDSARLGDLKAGPMDLDFTGDRHGLSVTGQCAIGSDTAAVAIVTGALQWEGDRRGGELLVSMPLGKEVSSVSLRRLLPEAPKGDVKGTLTTHLVQRADSNAVIEVLANVSELDLDDPALLLEELVTCCRLNLQTLPASLPNQQLTIERAMLGSLLWEDVEALYRVEHDRSLTIQSVNAAWCGGKIDLRGVTLRPGLETLDILVHADRVQVSALFRQLNLPAATGDSSLSGRIPIRWHRGHPRFKDGFLSTRPGRSGKISFGDTDAIAGALALGAGEDARLALVGAALKEFAYEWITLTLDSEGDELLARMSLFGKPARKIPYRYENKSGTYVVTASREEWSSPEMQVDLNFHIPLDDIMTITVQTTKRLQGNL